MTERRTHDQKLTLEGGGFDRQIARRFCSTWAFRAVGIWRLQGRRRRAIGIYISKLNSKYRYRFLPSRPSILRRP